MEGLPTEKLTKESDVVIIGAVEVVESKWSKDGTTIFTSAVVTVSEVVRGVFVEQRIVIEYAGGEVGDVGLRVSDVMPLKKDEIVLLFLKSGTSKVDGTVYNIVGNAQGRYTIDENKIASKSGFSIVSNKDVIDNNIPVDELIKKIREVK